MLLYGSNRLTSREVLQAIFRRRWLVTLVFVLTIIPVVVATFTAPKVYEGTAKVLVHRNDRPGAVQPHSPRLTQEEEIKSELEIAASRPVLENILRAELQRAERPDEETQNSVQEVDATAAKPVESKLEQLIAILRRKMQRDSISLYPPAGIPQEMKPDTSYALELALAQFRRRITVAAVSGANVIEISYRDSNPARAARLTNALADAYTSYTDQVHRGKAVEEFLAERIRVAKAKLDSLESVLQTYRVANEMVSYNKQESMLLEKYNSFDRQLVQKREQIVALEREIQRLQQLQAGEDTLTIPTSDMDAHPTVQRLYNKLIDLRLERKSLEERYDSRNQVMVELARQTAGVRQELSTEISRLLRLKEEKLRSLLREEKDLADLLHEQKTDLKAYPRKERALKELELAIENAQKIYSQLVLRQEELRVEKATDSRISRITVISPASIPLHPISPRTGRNLAFGILFGLLLSVAAGLLREFYDSSFKSPEELSVILGTSVLATISSQEQAGDQHLLHADLKAIAAGRNGNGHVAKEELPGNQYLNPFRFLQEKAIVNEAEVMTESTSLPTRAGSNGQDGLLEFPATLPSGGDKTAARFCGRRLPRAEIEKLRGEVMMLRWRQNAKVIGFAGAHKGEGTTTILANLALLLQQTDLRILLVDLNALNPELPALFSLPNQRGLIEMIKGRCNLQEVTHVITPGRLSLLSLGRPEAAANLDFLTVARYILSAARYTEACDVILLDLPPLNECAQALQVAQGAEGIVMVVQTERTRAEVARTLKNELDRLGVRILGAVLNRRKFYIPKSIYKHL
jgi:succinoglycan biosynthesis transport protein ExoP